MHVFTSFILCSWTIIIITPHAQPSYYTAQQSCSTTHTTTQRSRSPFCRGEMDDLYEYQTDEKGCMLVEKQSTIAQLGQPLKLQRYSILDASFSDLKEVYLSLLCLFYSSLLLLCFFLAIYFVRNRGYKPSYSARGRGTVSRRSGALRAFWGWPSETPWDIPSSSSP